MKMNTPNPLLPQGSLLDKGKSHFRITVFATLAVHVVLLCVLLIAGCNKKTEQTADSGLAPQPSETWPTNNGAVPPPLPPPPPPSPITTQEVAAPTPPPPPVPDHFPPAPPVPEMTLGSGTDHTIVKGETLATIGKKYGVGYKAIEAANPGINATRLKIGDKIKIPPARTPTTLPGANASTGNGTGTDGAKSYKVKSGDNLGKIGKAYGVSPKQLRAANNLKTDQIKVGQTLKIPAHTSTAGVPAPIGDATAPPPVPPLGLPPQ